MNAGRRGIAIGGSVLATAALLAVPAAGLGDGSAAGPIDAATIKMIGGKNDLRFKGPKTVQEGQELRIRNATSVEQIGPHTFSLVDKDARPKADTKKQIKKCIEPGHICLNVATAHEFDPDTDEINKHEVENGAIGWDTSFTKTEDGDSWYTEVEDETTTRVVSAAAGTKLHYFCAVHPFMQGKFEVAE